MKANELMIGDWVLCDMNAQSDYEFDNVDYQPYQIADGEDIDYAIENNKIGDADVYQPLPITKEMLEKNGFELVTSGKDYEFAKERGGVLYRWKDIPNAALGGYMVSFIFFDEESLTKTMCKLWNNKGTGANSGHLYDMLYVHQLQHALRLSGIDKEIKF